LLYHTAHMQVWLITTLSKKLFSLLMQSSISTANSFLWGPFCGVSACTVWILYACSFSCLWRTFCTFEQGFCSFLLAWWVDFQRLCLTSTLTVSVSTEGLPVLFLCWTLPVSLTCTSHPLIVCPSGAFSSYSRQ
jgi:hypothetical protein